MDLKVGQKFKAKDKLGRTISYLYEGEEKQENGYNIRLHNLDDNTKTYVEKQWFEQRKIELV